MLKLWKILVPFIFAITTLPSHAEERKQAFSKPHKFIFFAVLEGLYEDGVKEKALQAMLGTSLHDNFVYACPICMPVYQALEVYKTRPPLAGDKLGRDTFGKGLDKETLTNLVDKGAKKRRETIRQLISKLARGLH